jgi:hypothetical protein
MARKLGLGRYDFADVQGGNPLRIQIENDGMCLAQLFQSVEH